MKLINLLFILLPILSTAQKVDWKKLKANSPDKILQSGERKPAQILLLGTFHFGYPQQDAHKTDSSRFIDVKSPRRQEEILQLVEVISRFKPTRVYVESSWSNVIDSLYKEYLVGRYELGRNEIYQVAFRVAGQAGLKKIYTVDAGNFANENYRAYPKIDSMWNLATLVDTIRDKYWQKMYSTLYNTSDSIEVTLTMLENFLLMAEPTNLARMHGHYLSAEFNTSNNDGPDILAMWWYSRNLRIFNNILKTRPGPDDRIMVLFGNGHVPILKHCFAASPEFELVELKSLLR